MTVRFIVLPVMALLTILACILVPIFMLLILAYNFALDAIELLGKKADGE
jgi:hypothetical protein